MLALGVLLLPSFLAFIPFPTLARERSDENQQALGQLSVGFCIWCGLGLLIFVPLFSCHWIPSVCLAFIIQCALLFSQGKEFETRLKEKKPGDLSDELRISLGMPVGPVSASYLTGEAKKRVGIRAEGRQRTGLGRWYPVLFFLQNAHKVPPPWLIAMQRYGPPPSYPNLKIPGLNSPIPEVSTGLSFLAASAF